MAFLTAARMSRQPPVRHRRASHAGHAPKMNHLDYRKARAPDMAIPDPTPRESTEQSALAASGRRVFEIEARGLQAVAARLDGAFSAACRLILRSEERRVGKECRRR